MVLPTDISQRGQRIPEDRKNEFEKIKKLFRLYCLDIQPRLDDETDRQKLVKRKDEIFQRLKEFYNVDTLEPEHVHAFWKITNVDNKNICEASLMGPMITDRLHAYLDALHEEINNLLVDREGNQTMETFADDLDILMRAVSLYLKKALQMRENEPEQVPVEKIRDMMVRVNRLMRTYRYHYELDAIPIIPGQVARINNDLRTLSLHDAVIPFTKIRTPYYLLAVLPLVLLL